MTWTFAPRSLLVTALFLVAFGTALDLAVDARRGLTAGALAVAAWLLVEALVAFNPAAWWREQSDGRR